MRLNCNDYTDKELIDKLTVLNYENLYNLVYSNGVFDIDLDDYSIKLSSQYKLYDLKQATNELFENNLII